MLGRQMAPAKTNVTAIDLSGFLLLIYWSELAIKTAIVKVKTELVNSIKIGKRGGE